MLSFTLSTTLLLAACLLRTSVVSTEKAVTCDANTGRRNFGRDNVQRLGCDHGVIRVQGALYGRADRETCSEGRLARQVANTRCSQRGTLDAVKRRCDGKKVCEFNSDAVRRSDPCLGTYKYLETNYTCFPAIRVIACEDSVAHLFCAKGQVIFVYGADYGRSDQTTCSYRRPASQVQNVSCTSFTSKTVVEERCNGKNNCTISATNSVLRDTCVGTYKYLEVAYICEYPLDTGEESSGESSQTHAE
ncbi:L-rhamnose-binding lectin SML-like [Acanthochromis polyacanthus]|uniref:L-rhamnose-binding lectin SML-like n=1 Tax=Acanthochromis polyacanthus TaxID=80966 RepID=UPI0022341A6D|nr:L-rhamnose-binding lectin SML-like [Acanthochromis polyacanthus]